MEQTATAIIIIGASMFFPLWIGAKAGEKDMNTINDFFILSRNMSLVTVFFTVQATWWSAFAFLGASSYYYYNGPVYWTTIGWDLFFAVLFLAVGKRIWFYGKENGYITATDFFIDIYQSKLLGVIITGIMMLFTIPYFQIQISGGAYLIEAASKGLIPSQMGAFIFTTVIVIYIWTGGLRAVAWADIFYEFLMIVSALLSGIYIIRQFHGMENLFLEISKVMPEALTLPGPNHTAGPMLWISMFVIVPIGAVMTPPLWIRMYAVREAKYFYLIPFLLGVFSFLNLGPMLIGNAGILLEKNLVYSDSLFPRILMNHTPYILAYTVLIGAAAAAMSTSNSQIHSISAIYTIDIHKRYINPNLNDNRLLKIGRFVILLFAVFSFLAYIYLPGLIIQIGLTALSGTAQIIVPTLGALFWKKSNSKGALAGLICGFSVLLTSYISKSSFGDIHSGLLALIFNSLAFITVSLLTKDTKNTGQKIEAMRLKYNRTFGLN